MAERGRPKIELTVEHRKQIETMSGLGMNLRQIAAVLGVTEITLKRRLSEDPDLFDTVEKGRAMAISVVARTAYQLATSGKVPAMTMFYLKCRAGWSEKPIEEIEAEARARAENQKRTATELLELVSAVRGEKKR